MLKISIIVPVYNSEKYLERCIESVVCQTYTEWELLLIDDGSTDKSGCICDNYSKADHRIKVYHISNGGVSIARNIGLDNASGDFVMFLDSDDYINTDCLENCCRLCEKNILDVLQYAIVRVRDGNILARYTCNLPILNGYDYLNTRRGLLCIGGNIIRSAIIDKTRFPVGIKYGEDRFFLLNIISRSTRVMRTSSIEYFYEDNPSSASHILKTDAIIRSIDLTVQLLKEFPDLKNYFNTVLVGYLLTIISNNDINYKSYKEIIDRTPIRISTSLRKHEIFYLLLNVFSIRFSFYLYKCLFIIKKNIWARKSL